MILFVALFVSERQDMQIYEKTTNIKNKYA